MKTSISNIINCTQVLQQLANTKLKISTSYKMKKIIDECNDVLKQFEARRTELLQEYATLDEEKNAYKFPEDDKEALEAYNQKINEVVGEEIDLDVPTISVEELDNVEGIEIEPAALDSIEWFIKHDEAA